MQATGADEVARRIRDGGGAQAAVSGTLEVVLGRVAKALDRQAQRDMRLSQLVNVVPIMGALPGNGTLDYPDRYGPTDGFLWDVRRITVSGFSAGTVTLFKNDVNSTQLYQWATTTPTEKTWSSQLWLRARDRLIFVAAGITGTVQLDGNAHLVSEQLLAEYIL
jgi:hypothetical protein